MSVGIWICLGELTLNVERFARGQCQGEDADDTADDLGVGDVTGAQEDVDLGEELRAALQKRFIEPSKSTSFLDTLYFSRIGRIVVVDRDKTDSKEGIG